MQSKNNNYNRFRNLKVVDFLQCFWPGLCNSRIAKIVSDEYSRLELLDLQGIIKFEVLLVEKFAVDFLCAPR